MGIERIIVSTYQAVSGAGQSAIAETLSQYEQILHQGKTPKEVTAAILPSAGDKNITLLLLTLCLKLISSQKMITLMKK